jgi:ketosteroid isomerase-like protein
MSQENVEIVLRGLEVWNAGDMAAFRELVAPDAIVRPPPNWPEPGPYVGREATMRYYGGIREAWDADTIELVGEPVAAADRVVVSFTWQGTGTGPEAKMEITAIYTVRNGRVRDMENFWDRAEALEAIGLRE